MLYVLDTFSVQFVPFCVYFGKYSLPFVPLRNLISINFVALIYGDLAKKRSFRMLESESITHRKGKKRNKLIFI